MRLVLILIILVLAAACGGGNATSTPVPATATVRPIEVTAEVPAEPAAVITEEAVVMPTVAATSEVQLQPTQPSTQEAAATSEVDLFVPEVISVRPHDPQSFTQGLVLHDGMFYESAGRYQQSNLRQVDPQTGEVIKSVPVEGTYFAEGLALVDDRLIQITWRESTAFVYDVETFEQTGTFNYTGEGWGLCYDGEMLYMSDGTPTITLRDPQTFESIGQLLVTLDGQPVNNLNELECVGDSIYANVWQTDFIVRIDTASGLVDGVINAAGLLTAEEKAAGADVLNGIAYDAENDVFLITGKLWPKMFEVRFVPFERPS